MKRRNKTVSLLIILIMVLSTATMSFAEHKNLSVVKSNIRETSALMVKQTPDPKVGSVSGEWTIMALARSDIEVPQSYFDNYYDNVVEYVKNKNGKLHDRKYTEYSRVILALTSIGKNPKNVGGYDLLQYLGDFDKVVYQGINGPIFALIALDSGAYEMPVCENAKVQATRKMYVQYILNKQIPLDGGFSLDGLKGDPDITAMALQALSKYKDDPDVDITINKALKYLQNVQQEDGGYLSWGAPNSESVDQVIMALTELKIDPQDKRFIKNGNTLMSNLLTFYGKGGGFMHVKPGDQNNGGAAAGLIDGMATDQGMYAMVAYDRYYQGKNSFYDMTDAKKKLDNHSVIEGKKINEATIIATKTFADIQGHKNKAAIEILAAKKIINGINEREFAPEKSMSRAEFCTLIMRALNIDVLKTQAIFNDVTSDKWYFDYVNTAYKKKIVSGVSHDRFNPMGTITKEEAAVMIYNAAKLLNMNTEISTVEVNMYLPQFTDYGQSATWSRQAFAFLIKNNIISSEDIELLPKKTLTRGEISQMLYHLLEARDK